MRTVIALIIALVTLFAAPLSAQVLSVETYIEEWDEASQSWVRLDGAERIENGANRLLSAPAAQDRPAIASYGPFRVIDRTRAVMNGVTDKATPRLFATMLRDFPDMKTLEMVDAPGTDDDRANMLVGRMIRDAGMATHVPKGGSVRSGAVELFLAGSNRQIDDGAEFAVHSWMDAYGRQPGDFAADAPENRIYLEYYQEMGMDAGEARAFYAMTNSVSYQDAKWLTAQDMRGWLGQHALEPAAPPVIPPKIEVAANLEASADYLDLDAMLP